MLPRAHLATGRHGQDAHLLEQGYRGDDTRHFHQKNGGVTSNLIVPLKNENGLLNNLDSLSLLK